VVLQAILDFFRALLASLSHPGQLWKGLREILRAICRLLRRLFSLHHRQRGGEGDCCIHLPDSYKRPDPLIYAQYYLMSMGLAVTWDNPDIELFEPGLGGPETLGAPVSSSALDANHVYRIRVRVWNGSYDAPAVGLPVHLSYLSFGAGTTSHPIATHFIDLGVKGSSKHPAFAFFDWRTPAQPGHYCLQTRLEWSDDANPDNNLGQENLNVGAAHSPAEFVFTVGNTAAIRRRIVLEADTYTLPELKPCAQSPDAETGRKRSETRLQESQRRWERARREQTVEQFPIPAIWTVTIDPPELVLAPGEERDVSVAVEIPHDAGVVSERLNINAFGVHDPGPRELIGGVTLQVERT
jgi:hypothetical protein